MRNRGLIPTRENLIQERSSSLSVSEGGFDYLESLRLLPCSYTPEKRSRRVSQPRSMISRVLTKSLPLPSRHPSPVSHLSQIVSDTLYTIPVSLSISSSPFLSFHYCVNLSVSFSFSLSLYLSILNTLPSEPPISSFSYMVTLLLLIFPFLLFHPSESQTCLKGQFR